MNTNINLSFDANGLLTRVDNLKDGSRVRVAQQYYEYYESSGGPYCMHAQQIMTSQA